MKINKYSPFAFVYFYVNKVALPFGLLYTTLLTPVFYLWLLTKGKTHILFKFLIVILPFFIAHLVNGVRAVDYLRSLFVFFSVYIFCYAAYTYVNRYGNLATLFRQLLVSNFILCLVAIPFLFTPFRDVFWADQYISAGVGVLPRLRMFTYEPSYYATLFAPIFLFYSLNIILGKQKATLSLLLMLFVPLLLSFSMGVIACSLLALFFLFLIQFLHTRVNRKFVVTALLAGFGGLLVLALLLAFYSDNPLFRRIEDIVTGQDISGRGRTIEAFQLAYIIAEAKSIWWGVGLGQLKIIGDPIIKEFYKYPPDYGQVSIPCAFAETLAIFGMFGVIIRLFVQLFLFRKTWVLHNYYQTVLFFYIFIYQFTGSFITNIAEYVIWVLAFSNVFPELNKTRENPAENRNHTFR